MMPCKKAIIVCMNVIVSAMSLKNASAAFLFFENENEKDIDHKAGLILN